MTTVMVVDDHERIRTVIGRLLAAEGHHVVEAANGAEALRKLTLHTVDLIVLDLVMPHTNGMQVLANLDRLGRAVPVIVLSAIDDVAARVEALDLGAVDYVAKPFNPAELAARVRRHLAGRTTAPARSPAASSRFLSDSGVELDLDRRRARIVDAWVPLTDRESRLLAHLMRRSGRVCSREELLREVWELAFDPGSNVVEACVRRLRAKLPGVPIQTVRSAGYCFEAG
jgi:DNA-binding response OmpR family regulator